MRLELPHTVRGQRTGLHAVERLEGEEAHRAAEHVLGRDVEPQARERNLLRLPAHDERLPRRRDGVAQAERKRADRRRLERLERRAHDVRVRREEEYDLARLGLGQVRDVDRRRALCRRREDDFGRVLALDRRQADVRVLQVGACGVQSMSAHPRS